MTDKNHSLSFLRSRPYFRRLFVHLLWLAIFILTTGARTTSAMTVTKNNSLTTVEILQNNGYAAEVHHIITKDGYVLEMHRIPKSKDGKPSSRNHPVIVQHGILGSSADWVIGGAEKSLPMQLADDGYDVWLTNSRGNIYSRKHVTMTCKQRAFWNFSLQELGTYDLPAVIDYILSTTKTSQLHYVGFSMGTSIFFIMASEKPEYQPKIRSQVSLAPVAFLSNTRSALRYVAPLAKSLNIIFQKTSNGMLPQSKFFMDWMCREKLTQKLICEKCIIFSVCGSDPYYFDKSLIPVIFGHFPAGTSSKLTAHFAQFMLKDCFSQYDYGPAENMLHYNSTEPPAYNLKSIKVPITLIYGKNDILADTKDVMKLKSRFPKLVDVMAVDNPYCNHVDLMWSVNVTGQVNDPVRESLGRIDRPDWTYAGPSAAAAAAGADDCGADGPGRPAPRPAGPDVAAYLDNVMGNLDAIIASTMPRTVDGGDRAAFDRQRELQAAMFGNAVRYFRSAEATWGDWSAGASDWTGTLSAGAARAHHAAVGGVERAHHAAVGGVERAQHAVVGGVGRAHQAVVGGVGRAETFVHDGLHKTDGAIGHAFNATLRGLSKAFWFIK